MLTMLLLAIFYQIVFREIDATRAIAQRRQRAVEAREEQIAERMATLTDAERTQIQLAAWQIVSAKW